jgi:hypothetical protein
MYPLTVYEQFSLTSPYKARIQIAYHKHEPQKTEGSKIQLNIKQSKTNRCT